MNILFINGSPRKSGNTILVVKKIIELLKKDKTNKIELINLFDYKLNGCLGCNRCQKVVDETGCVQNDDITELIKKIINSDIIFYATPLYGHSYSGQLKLVLDRHVCLFKFIDGNDKSVEEMEIKSFVKDKPVGLIVTCQGPEENNTELIQMQFDKFCESSLTRCIGKYIFPFCNEVGNKTIFSQEKINRILEDIRNI